MPPHPFVTAFAEHAARVGVLLPDTHSVIALSGGPDSTALLLAWAEAARDRLLPAPIVAAHFHHGLRGDDADKDAAFSAALAAQVNVACRIELGAVAAQRSRAANKAMRTSPNAAARRARYHFLIETAQNTGAQVIATAHTASDQVETVLLRLLRGASPEGLAGIPVRREIAPGIWTVRPLLPFSREQISGYLQDRRITARQDPSNDLPRYLRGRLRADLPGWAARYNPRLPDAVLRLAEQAARDADYWETVTDTVFQQVASRVAGEFGDGVRIDAAALRAEHPAIRHRVLRNALVLAGGSDEFADAGEGPHPNTLSRRNIEVLERLLRQRGGVDIAGALHARSDGCVLQLTRSRPRDKITGERL